MVARAPERAAGSPSDGACAAVRGRRALRPGGAALERRLRPREVTNALSPNGPRGWQPARIAKEAQTTFIAAEVGNVLGITTSPSGVHLDARLLLLRDNVVGWVCPARYSRVALGQGRLDVSLGAGRPALALRMARPRPRRKTVEIPRPYGPILGVLGKAEDLVPELALEDGYNSRPCRATHLGVRSC